MAQATAVATARTAPPINIESPSTSEEEGPTGAGMTFEEGEKEREEAQEEAAASVRNSIELQLGC